MQPQVPDDQAEIVAFLRSPEAYLAHTARVECFETHGAFIFAVGDDAYKIKRAVHYAYMDFSTLERRRDAIEKELSINRRHAPAIYLGIVAVTREDDGRLRIDGEGIPVEWALHMRRFDQTDLLSNLAERSKLEHDLCISLADVVWTSHRASIGIPMPNGTARLQIVIDEISHGLSAHRAILPTASVEGFRGLANLRLCKAQACLDARARAGCIRRCHGDLHLGNIVLWQGMPTLFDAIEFSDEIATIDTLYDLSFLLMDLDQRGLRGEANTVLNRYLWRADQHLDLEGLIALPLFLGLRSAIRAMVEAQRSVLASGPDAATAMAKARRYLDHAMRYLQPEPARLVAVGGLSGTGKSTLAARIAPALGSPPGAVHLRSDLERKSMLGAAPTERLPSATYTQAMSDKVYARVLEKARVALTAGHSVVVDAVFSKPSERDAVAALARKLAVPFAGLWLDAPRQTLLARVAARQGDASDATPAVVEAQLASPLGAIGWPTIDAGGTAENTLRSALAKLARPLSDAEHA